MRLLSIETKENDMTDCITTHLCAFAPIIKERDLNADDDLRAETDQTWLDISQDAEESGDGLDYDGPLTWARAV
jgi:hypothetical protein